MPYRIATPPPPEEPETEEPYAAVIRAQRRRARLMTVAIALCIVGGAAKVAHSGTTAGSRPTQPRNDEAERIAAARTAIESARMRARAAQARYDHGVRAAIGEDLGPRADLGTCPIALPAPTTLVKGRAAFPLVTIEHADLKEQLPSPTVAAVLADVARAEKHLAAGRWQEAKLYARALDRDDRFGWDVVLVAKSSKRPKAVTGGEFVAGELSGRAYLYDFASGRVVCAANIAVKSSKEIGYNFSDVPDAPAGLGPIAMMSDAIEEDMRLQVERAIVRELVVRAGPSPSIF